MRSIVYGRLRSAGRSSRPPPAPRGATGETGPWAGLAVFRGDRPLGAQGEGVEEASDGGNQLIRTAAPDGVFE
jgi:hypothetical protein